MWFGREEEKRYIILKTDTDIVNSARCEAGSPTQRREAQGEDP